MKIETVALEDQQTKLIAEMDTETLERYKHQAARKISQSAKIPGFRPGKAPYDLIRRMYGDEAIQQEAVELMLDEIYPEVLREANVNPSGPGKLEEIVSMDPPTFAFVVPLPPEVELGDYQSIRKDYEPEQITDEQVEHTLLHLQRSYATAEPVERPAQTGDMVSIKVSAKRTQVEESEEETLIPEMPYQMIAGEDDEEEGSPWPYAGFTQELVGMSENETKTVVHTFDEESDFENLRGKEAEFTFTVQNIKELHLPELTDEFAQGLGEFETLEDLRKAVRSQLEQNYRQQFDQKYFDELIEEVVAQATIKYPPHLLDEEIEQFVEGVQHSLERDRLDLETYLKMREMDRPTFIEQEVKPAATRRLVRSLVLEEFARRENIEVKSEEIQTIYYTALQQMEQSKDLHKVQTKNKQSAREMANSIAINTVNTIFNQRLMSRLKALASGKEEEAQIEGLTPEAGLSSSEASAVYSEQAADDEQAVAEEQLTSVGTEAVIDQAVASEAEKLPEAEELPEAEVLPEVEETPAAETKPDAEIEEDSNGKEA